MNETHAPRRSAARLAQTNGAQSPSRSFWQDARRRLLRDRLTMAALAVLAALTVICFIGPPIAYDSFGIDPNRTNIRDKYVPPGEGGYVFGTDNLGRDQMTRLMVGGQISLTIAYLASILSIVIGVTTGGIAGYLGGVVDDIFIWLITTLTSIPQLFLLLLAAVIFTPTPLVLVIILALLSWVDTARLARGEVLQLREAEFAVAARAIGAPTWRILWSHLLPNLLPIIVVDLAIRAGILILAESGLSFLGLGIQPPTPSWGNMLSDARSNFARGGHLVVMPGVFISLAVICFYLLSDGLRDALDPQSRKQ